MTVVLVDSASCSCECPPGKDFHQLDYEISLNPMTLFRMYCIHSMLNGMIIKTFKFVLQQPGARLYLTEDNVYCIIDNWDLLSESIIVDEMKMNTRLTYSLCRVSIGQNTVIVVNKECVFITDKGANTQIKLSFDAMLKWMRHVITVSYRI